MLIYELHTTAQHLLFVHETCNLNCINISNMQLISSPILKFDQNDEIASLHNNNNEHVGLWNRARR
jgi:hypothetical protein